MPGTADKNSPDFDQRRNDAVDWILGRINYERAKTGTFSARDFKLDRMAELLKRIGNPQTSIPVVHVAGTKGKGSCSTMLAAILTQAGYRTGLFTSPHIDRFEERMTVDGQQPAAQQFVELFERCRTAVEEMDRLAEPMPPTYFEIATAMAWLYFTACQCEIVVLEVGLGGRLDSTNICQPEVCMITSISLDHTAVLGNTIPEIAAEKAGIIKQAVTVISGATDPLASETIARIAKTKNAPLCELNDQITVSNKNDSITVSTPFGKWIDVQQPLPGAHQARNLALVLATVDQLNQSDRWAITDKQVRAGLRNVRCPLRIEVVAKDPLTIVDTAHNEASCRALAETLNSSFPDRQPRTLVFATTGGKDVNTMLKILLPEFETVVLTQYAGNPRFLPLDELKKHVTQIGHNKAIYRDTIRSAWEAAQTTNAELICVTGSFFLASEMRSYLRSADQ